MKRLGALVIGMLLPGTGAAQAADTVYYYSSDTIHSEVVVTDQNRNVVERTYYAPYGQVLNRDLRDGPGYTGHEEDPETNLVYMQQRYYDPEAGRFLSTDPVQADGNGGSFNRYEYANDNPYRYTDPDGRESGAGYATGEYTIALPPSSPDAREAALTMVGLVPVVGDVQNVVDAYNNPSVATIAIAAVGLVPEAGAAIADVAKVAKAAKAAGRVGDFTRAQKNAAKAENAAINGGKMACTDCGKALENVKSEKGVPTPSNQAQAHHDPAIKNGGGQHSEPVVLCPTCHKERHGSDGE